MDKQIFCGSKPSTNIIRVISNRKCFPKPFGGLWTSTYDPQRISAWVDWCKNNFRESAAPDFKRWMLTVKDEANIFHLDSITDFNVLRKDGFIFVNPLKAAQIDYELLSTKYDGIHITERALQTDWTSYDCGGHFSLSVWDVESTCWFRWVFTEVEECVPTR